MKNRSLGIRETMSFLSRRRPALAVVFNGFAPLLELRETVAAELPGRFPDLPLPEADARKMLAGAPLLAGFAIEPLIPAILYAGERLLPAIMAIPALAPHGERLTAFFGDGEKAAKLLAAVLAGDGMGFAEMAREEELPPAILNFAADFIFSTVLRGLTRGCMDARGDYPWDAEAAWNHGYCPVCGEKPVIAWLDRPNVDEANAFLVGGGGKKHFHCGFCGVNWPFPRSVCPECGKEGEGVMEILREEGSHGERLDVCASCGSYCPTVDLREFADIPDMDAMVLGMLHMDIIAARKSLLPLKRSFWNVFESGRA